MRFLKVLFVSLGSFGAALLANFLLDRVHMRLGSLSLIALYLVIASAFLYFPVPKRSLSVGKLKKKECILDGHGNLTNTIFVPSEYRDYTEASKNQDGRVLVNSLGNIVCTRYALPNQSNPGTSRIHLLFLCFVSVALSTMLQNLWPLILEERLEPFPRFWFIGKSWPDALSILSTIQDNLLSMKDALFHIRPKLDILKCLEIIKSNLEQLSILYFNG